MKKLLPHELPIRGNHVENVFIWWLRWNNNIVRSIVCAIMGKICCHSYCLFYLFPVCGAKFMVKFKQTVNNKLWWNANNNHSIILSFLCVCAHFAKRVQFHYEMVIDRIDFTVSKDTCLCQLLDVFIQLN